MVYNDLDYVGKNEEEDKDEVQPVAPVTSGQPSAVNPAAPQTQPAERKGSGKFTNIKKYVDANQGGGQQLGQGIQNKIGQEAESVRKGIESAQNQFQQGAQQTQQTLDKGTGYAQQVGQTGGAQQIAGSQPDFQTFRDIYTGQVKGPDQTISSQQDSTAKLNALSQLAGNEAGRFDLLNRTFTKPTQDYTQGEKRFDQLLLQATPDVTKNLQTYSNAQGKDVQGRYDAADASQKAEVQRLMDLGVSQQDALNQATGTYDATADTGTGALGNVYSELSNAQQAAKAKQDADVLSLQGSLANYGKETKNNPTSFLSPEQAALLGLDPNLRTYGTDITQFAPNLRASDTDITRADVANDEQNARLNALYQLSGNDPSSINLGTKEGRQGAEFGEDFQGALNASRQGIASNLANTFTGVDSNAHGYNGKTPLQQIGMHLGDLATLGSTSPETASEYTRLINSIGTDLSAAVASGDTNKENEIRQSYAEQLRQLTNNINPNMGTSASRLQSASIINDINNLANQLYTNKTPGGTSGTGYIDQDTLNNYENYFKNLDKRLVPG